MSWRWGGHDLVKPWVIRDNQRQWLKQQAHTIFLQISYILESILKAKVHFFKIESSRPDKGAVILVLPHIYCMSLGVYSCQSPHPSPASSSSKSSSSTGSQGICDEVLAHGELTITAGYSSMHLSSYTWEARAIPHPHRGHRKHKVKAAEMRAIISLHSLHTTMTSLPWEDSQTSNHQARETELLRKIWSMLTKRAKEYSDLLHEHPPSWVRNVI